jgi:hypothetical protein
MKTEILLAIPALGLEARGDRLRQRYLSTPEQNYTIRRSKNAPLWRCGRLSIGSALRRALIWLTQPGGGCGNLGL